MVSPINARSRCSTRGVSSCRKGLRLGPRASNQLGFLAAHALCRNKRCCPWHRQTNPLRSPHDLPKEEFVSYHLRRRVRPAGYVCLGARLWQRPWLLRACGSIVSWGLWKAIWRALSTSRRIGGPPRAGPSPRTGPRTIHTQEGIGTDPRLVRSRPGLAMLSTTTYVPDRDAWARSSLVFGGLPATPHGAKQAPDARVVPRRPRETLTMFI